MVSSRLTPRDVRGIQLDVFCRILLVCFVHECPFLDKQFEWNHNASICIPFKRSILVRVRFGTNRKTGYRTSDLEFVDPANEMLDDEAYLPSLKSKSMIPAGQTTVEPEVHGTKEPMRLMRPLYTAGTNPRPKRFYRSFWRGISKRAAQLSASVENQPTAGAETDADIAEFRESDAMSLDS